MKSSTIHLANEAGRARHSVGAVDKLETPLKSGPLAWCGAHGVTRPTIHKMGSSVLWKLLCISLLSFVSYALANEREEPNATTESNIITRENDAPSETEVAIEATADDASNEVVRKDWSYLGIATSEASEALAAQLGLRNGAGLVVTYVGPDSPAAKGGLQKNDVLVRLGEQWLVHPAQLRKLIHSHKQGEVIELTFYRAGKEQTGSVTLGQIPPPKIRVLGDLPPSETRLSRKAPTTGISIM